MSLHRHHLPLLLERRASQRPWVCDGGIETTLIYHEGLELPAFAAFTLLKSAAGSATLHRYFDRFADIARRHRAGLLLEAVTWRANRDWGRLLGYSAAELEQANRQAIRLLSDIRARWSATVDPIVISGVLGPRGDGYNAARRMTASEAADYHAEQIAVFADTEADLISAYTLNYTEEAIGIARAAQAYAMPVALSFTLETDGRLPSGQSLRDAIEATDRACGAYPLYYLINCAHPTHFAAVLADGGAWRDRIRGLRANASSKSHAQLDASTSLDAGDPLELGRQYKALTTHLRKLSVLGGCCGTDHRHISAICEAVMA